MPRAIDVQLLVVAIGAGGGVAWWAWRRSPAARVGMRSLLGALILAWVADRRLVHAVPRDLVDGLGPWILAGAMAVVVGWGASRLPTTPTLRVPPVVPLALASLVGVWLGVPETSVAILVAGVVLGLAAVLVAGRGTLTRPAAVAVAVVPIVAAVVGAAGEGRALVGGLLCSATFVTLGLGRRLRAVSGAGLLAASAAHLGLAVVAARHIGVSRSGAGALVAVALVIGLSLAAASELRRRQGRPAA